jgi:hypothetical protein
MLGQRMEHSSVKYIDLNKKPGKVMEEKWHMKA